MTPPCGLVHRFPCQRIFRTISGDIGRCTTGQDEEEKAYQRCSTGVSLGEKMAKSPCSNHSPTPKAQNPATTKILTKPMRFSMACFLHSSTSFLKPSGLGLASVNNHYATALPMIMVYCRALGRVIPLGRFVFSSTVFAPLICFCVRLLTSVRSHFSNSDPDKSHPSKSHPRKLVSINSHFLRVESTNEDSCKLDDTKEDFDKSVLSKRHPNIILSEKLALERLVTLKSTLKT